MGSARSTIPRIPDHDPLLLAAMSAPIEDMPETEQEKLDIEEARAIGRFISCVELTRALAAR